MKLLLWSVFFGTTGSLFACSLNVLSMNMWSSRINIYTGNLHNVSLNSQKNYSIQNPTLFEERGVNSKYSFHVGQFTLWTQPIKLSLFCNTPLRHSVSDSLETILRLFWIFWQNPWPQVIHDDAGFMKKKNHVEVKKSRKGVRSKNIETLDAIVTSRNNFHVYVFTSVSFRPQTPPLIT